MQEPYPTEEDKCWDALESKWESPWDRLVVHDTGDEVDLHCRSVLENEHPYPSH